MLRHFLFVALVATLSLFSAVPTARAQTAGTLDSTFSPYVDGEVYAMAVQPDGKIIVGGSNTAFSRSVLARFNADGSVDTAFTPTANAGIYSVAVQADGKILLGGGFFSVTGSDGTGALALSIARLNADGSLDTGFQSIARTNGGVFSIAVQTDGKILLGGNFSSVNGSTVSSSTGVNNIARLNADGTLDTSFNTSGGIGLGGANGNVRTIAVQPDGKILIGGEFTSVNGSAVSTSTGVNRIARLNADGTRDTDFNSSGGTGFGGANNTVNSIALQPDGKILIGGSFTSVNGSTVSTTTGLNRIARLNSNGSRDAAFNTSGGTGLGGANDQVTSIAVQADGRILLAGYFTSVNGSTVSTTTGVNRIARLNPNGSRDTAFNTSGGVGLGGANFFVEGVALQADGKILLGGQFSTVNGTVRASLARLNNDTLVPTLATPDASTVRWERPGAAPALSEPVTIEQSTNGGTTWSTLGTATRIGTTENWQLTGLSLPSGGLLRARGRTTGGYQNGSSGIVQQVEDFGSAGSLATSFNPAVSGGSGYVLAKAVQPDGKLIIGGGFTTVGTTSGLSNLARINADGSVDATFSARTNGDVYSVALQSDGKILLGGAFTSVNGSTVSATTGLNRFARLNADGSLDTGFNVNAGTGLGGANANVLCVALQSDGKILLGGSFTSINGSAVSGATGVNGIARLNADGSRDTTFNSSAGTGLGGVAGSVFSMAVQADGKIVLGGNFASVNGSAVSATTGVNCIARLNADGSRDTAFNSSGGTGLGGANSTVLSVTVAADGKILLGGSFTGVNGATGVNRIARLNADGSRDTAFNTSGGTSLGGADAEVYSIVSQADGKILLGGLFTSVNGSTVSTATGVNRVARLNADGSLDTAFNTSGGTGLGGANGPVYALGMQADGKILLGGAFTSVNSTARSELARLNNDAATQALSVLDTSQVLWTRSGAVPEVSQVTFDRSSDGGSTWTSVGTGTRVGTSSNWALTGLSLPTSGYLRARARISGDYLNGSSGVIEQVVAYPPTGPLVVSPTSGSVTSSGATLGGFVASTGGANVTERGVVYSRTATNNDPIIGGSGVTQVTLSGGGNGFSTSVTGLGAHTGYTYKAYATNSIGTTYTSAATFTTANTSPAPPNGVTAVSTTGTTGDQKTINSIFPATDADGDSVSIVSATSGTGVTVDSFTGTTVTFTPRANFTGAGSFSYTVSDGFGGSTTATVAVTVTDNDAPVITSVPANVTVEATNAAGAVVTYSAATATDNIGVTSINYSKASGTTFALGTTTVDVTASDAAGNTSAVSSFTVTVRDTTAPVITSVPDNITVEATSAAGAVVTYNAGATATDAVGVTAINYSKASGSTFALGTTTVNVTASDAAGNTSAVSSFTVTVRDTTAPVITSVPSNITVEATSAAGAVVTYAEATATDAVGVTAISYSKASGSTFALGTTTVNVTASDAAGNTSVVSSFTVTVRDTTAPVITSVPSNITVEATSAAGRVVTYTAPTATDAVDGSVTVTCSPASGSVFALGTTTVTCTATDSRSNSSSATFTVTVLDPDLTHAPGTLDPTLSTGVSLGGRTVYATAVQPDGKVIVAGTFGTVGNTSGLSNIARLNSDGSVDSTFNASTNDFVLSVAVQSDGKILLGGFFTRVNGSPLPLPGGNGISGFARLNADGSLDTTFNRSGGSPLGGANSGVNCVVVQPNGKILIGGSFTSVNGTNGINRIARLNADGTLDTAFGSGLGGADQIVNSIALQPDGKILIGGLFTSVNGSTGVNRIARLNADGSRDTAFNTSGGTSLGGANGFVYSIAVQADGKILLGGDFTSINGSAVDTTRGVNRIARLNADGSLDAAFNSSGGIGLGGVNQTVRSIVVQADGKVLLGGSFTSVNGSAVNANTGVNYFTRLNADGSLDTAFNASGGIGLGGANDFLTSIALQANGRILIGGRFTAIGGTTRNGLARLYNDAVTQTLSAPDATQVLWTRTGAGPELSHVIFERSSDSGSTWTSLGAATRVGTSANWGLAGLSLPTSGQLRARGRTYSGNNNGTSGLIEQVTSYTILYAPTVTTPTVTGVTSTDATLGGNVTADGGATVTERGVVYAKTSLNSDPALGGSDVTKVTASGTTGVFTTNVTGLSAHTGYTFKAYATNSTGTAYTSTATFTTDNTAPTAPDGSTTGTTGDQKTVTVSFPATDADGDSVSISAATSGTGVTVNSFTGSTVTFTPDASFTGNGSFSYTVSDGFGGTATGTITVLVTDNDAPVITSVPGNITVEATSAAGAVVTYAAATATDNVGVTSINYSSASGNTFALGTTTVNVTASDAAGNTSAVSSFTVTVRDTSAPVISGVPANITTTATSASGAIVTFTEPTALDAVDGAVTVTCVPASGSTFAIGTTTVTCTATDSRSNSSGATFTVTVVPNTAAPGDLDTTFGTGGKVITDIQSSDTEFARSVAVQGDGKIVVAGEAHNLQSYDFALVRYQPDGTLDSSFGGEGVVTTDLGVAVGYGTTLRADQGYSVAVQGDGKIVVAGTSGDGFGHGRFAVARYLSDGALDAGFGTSGRAVAASRGISDYSDICYGMAVQSDGNIVLAGATRTHPYDGFAANLAVVRYRSFGVLDAAFGDQGTAITDLGTSEEESRSVVMQGDGKIVVAGTRDGAFALARYTSMGALDTDFGNGGAVITGFGAYAEGNSVAVQGDGKIVVAGTCGGAFALARYTSAGDLDTGFGAGGFVMTGVDGTTSEGRSVAVQSDGKIVVAGHSYTSTGGWDFMVARYRGDGTLDSGFGTGGVATVDFGNAEFGASVAVQNDGKIVVAGASGLHFAVARFEGGDATATFPTVTTPTSGNVAASTAILGGSVPSDGFATLIERGVVYAVSATNSDPTIGGTGVTQVVASGATTGIFTANVRGLNAATVYSFKAYATNTEGTSYSSVGTFTTAAPGVIFSEDFSGVIGGGFNGGQYESGLDLAFGAGLVGWSRIGSGTAHIVDRANQAGDLVNPRNFAVMFWTDNVITLTSGIEGSNVLGQVYTVSYEASPCVYQSGEQATADPADAVKVEVVRADDVVLQSHTYHPGVWGGNMAFSADQFNYTGDGSGDVRIRISPATQGLGRFAGAVDNLVVRAVLGAPVVVMPTGASVTAFTATLGGNVTSDGNQAITERGVVYAATATNSDPLIGGTGVTKVTVSGTTGIFTTPVSSLAAHTSYTYKAYATNSVGTTYTSAATFTTLNTAPTAPNGSTTGTTGDQKTVTLSFPATDADGDSVSISAATSGTGVAVNSFTGTTVTFTPSASFTGDGSFSYTVSDGFGGSATGTITVVVTDNDAPVITSVPGSVTVEATSAAGAVVTYGAATASDNVGVTSIDYSKASGSSFALGTTTVSVTASDAAGNTSAVSSFTVTVRDTTGPVISGVPGNIVTTATSNAGAVAGFTAPTARDAVDGTVTVTCTPASGSTFPVGTTTVTCTATDSRSNSSSASFTVTVNQASQTISFTLPGTAAPSDQLTLSATGGASGNPVTFSVTSGPGTISGNTLSFTGVGNVTVKASQAGSAGYAAATDVSQTVAVTSAALTVMDDVFFMPTGRQSSILLDVLANDVTASGTMALVSVTSPGPGVTAKIEGTKIRVTRTVASDATISFSYTATNGPTSGSATVTLKSLNNAVGSYVGLLSAANGEVRGRVRVTITSAGAMTGVVQRDRTTSQGFKAPAGGTGTAQFTDGRQQPYYTLQMTPGATAGQLNVNVPTELGEKLSGVMEKLTYSAGNPCPYAGSYTFIANRVIGGTGPEVAVVQTATVTTTGAVTLVGARGYGITLSSAGSLLGDGRYLYYQGTSIGGAVERLGGTLQFTLGATRRIGGSLRWVVPAGASARISGAVAENYDVVGAGYTAAAGGVTMFSPTANSATLSLTYPDLTAPLNAKTQVFSLAGGPYRGAQTITVPKMSLVLRPATGYFTTKQTLANGQIGYGFGIVLQGAGINQGQGFSMDNRALGELTLTP